MQARPLRAVFAGIFLAATLPAAAADANTDAPSPDTPQADFLMVGSYHMNNPGRDANNTKADDVRTEQRQREIVEVARLLERYKPTRIMVEANPSGQATLDQRFANSCHGARPLESDEREQLGFRIACDLKLSGVVAVDWNDLGPIKDEDSVDYLKAVERNGQQALYQAHKDIGKRLNEGDQHTLDDGTVLDMLERLNSPTWLQANGRAYYRIGMLGTVDDPIGANWDMLWYGRNRMIFNNIARHTQAGDRILVIYGAGHGNHLRQLAKDSGIYRVQDTMQWLSDDPAR